MFYLKQMTSKKGKTVWIVGVEGTADHTFFAKEESAKKAHRDLENGQAGFCKCGQWILYQGGRSHHTCIAEF